MASQTPKTRYTTAQILIHWLTLILIVGAFFTHEAMEEIVRQLSRGAATIEPGTPTPHTVMGAIVLVLTLVRIVLRITKGAPPEPAGQSRLITVAAHAGHGVLYLLLIALPASGIAAWFGGIEAAGRAHGVLFTAMLVVVLGHAAMALFHQFVLKDGLISRMSPHG